jgi:hypothetical protein
MTSFFNSRRTTHVVRSRRVSVKNIAERLEPLRNRLHIVVLRSRLPVFDCGARHRLGVVL